jgi:hypothetical protein
MLSLVFYIGLFGGIGYLLQAVKSLPAPTLFLILHLKNKRHDNQQTQNAGSIESEY